jgi:hypothetical protein
LILQARRLLLAGRSVEAAGRLEELDREVSGEPNHRLELAAELLATHIHSGNNEAARRVLASAQDLQAEVGSDLFSLRLGLLKASLDHLEGGAAASGEAFSAALARADAAGMKRGAWEALVWRLNRITEFGEEGGERVAHQVLERSAGPWAVSGRALAVAVGALACQELDEGRESERLASLPGPRSWRLSTFKTIAAVGAELDLELARRARRQAAVLSERAG